MNFAIVTVKHRTLTITTLTNYLAVFCMTASRVNARVSVADKLIIMVGATLRDLVQQSSVRNISFRVEIVNVVVDFHWALFNACLRVSNIHMVVPRVLDKCSLTGFQKGFAHEV